eukprot:ANDGO_07362.mRNA.1 hypothetical protein
MSMRVPLVRQSSSGSFHSDTWKSENYAPYQSLLGNVPEQKIHKSGLRWTGPYVSGYDPRRLHGWTFLDFSGSVLRSRFMWIQLVFLLVVSGVSAVIVDYGFHGTQNLPWIKHVYALENDFSSGMYFFAGFFVSLTIGRWWSIRTSVQLYMAALSDLLLHTAMTFKHESLALPPIKNLLLFVERYCRAFYVLMLSRYATTKTPGFTKSPAIREDYFHGLEISGTLTRDEITQLRDADPAACVDVLIANIHSEFLWVKAHNPDAIQRVAEHFTADKINRIRSIAVDIDTFRLHQIPYLYVHFITFLVKVYLFIQAVLSGYEYQQDYLGKSGGDQVIGVVFNIITLGFLNAFLQGILELHSVLWFPFGKNPNHFPHFGMFQWVDGHLEAVKSAIHRMHLRKDVESV